MSDFDLSLIREFRNRPAFYDRNSPLFKDKTLNAQAWQDIANILGYDVALLKDRMLQLRNRYNLEKRRLEQLAEEDPGKAPQSSPWPLYEHLGFLSEHIRARRSFKRLTPREASTDMMNTMSGSSHSNITAVGRTIEHAATPLTNGLLAVKMEDESDNQSDSQSSPNNGDESNNNKIHRNRNHKQPAAAVSSIQQQQPPKQSITIRNLDSMRNTIIPITSEPPTPTQLHLSNNIHNHAIDEGVAEKKRCLSARELKYVAFGKFVASSLVELPKRQAMLLVEKFTSELVNTSIQNK